MRTRAESTYLHWCIHNPPDSYPAAGRLRTKLRAILDEVDEDLKGRRPADWADHQRHWTVADVEERDAEREAALAEAMAEDDADTAGREVEDDADIAGREREGDAEAAEGKLKDHDKVAEGLRGD